MTDISLIQHALMSATPGQCVTYYIGNLALDRVANDKANAVGDMIYSCYLDGIIDMAQIATGIEKHIQNGGVIRQFRYVAIKLPAAGIEKRSARRREIDKPLAEYARLRAYYKKGSK